METKCIIAFYDRFTIWTGEEFLPGRRDRVGEGEVKIQKAKVKS
jgi:hypothetical protein